MSSERIKALNRVIKELEEFKIDYRIYYDDLEPMSSYDNLLCGKIQCLLSFVNAFGWNDLSKQIDSYFPISGNAKMVLDNIIGFAIPEVRYLLQNKSNDQSPEIINHLREDIMSWNTEMEKAVWKSIEIDYDISKKVFGKNIRFIKDEYKRKIIFRDVCQAYHLAQNGFSKPAIILAGSICEELIRNYLIYKKSIPAKKTFDAYIEACEKNNLLKSAIHSLADAIRHFRNLVHMEKEKSIKFTLSKPTAIGAVASIFTLSNDFET